jgi:hypothetical protein
MRLGPDEILLKTYYHHYTPYLVDLAKIFGAMLPFYFLLFLFREALTFKVLLIFNIFIVLLFGMVTLYVTLVYWLDKLVVTNKRLIYMDWKYLTIKTEYETEIKDIQDIISMERGFISMFAIFDYGTLEIKTSSNISAIVFEKAPNPNGIKKFIQHILATLYSQD